MLEPSIIDRYLSDARSITEARRQGRLGFDEAATWIHRLDEVLFFHVDTAMLKQLEHEFEHEFEGHVVLDVAEHPGFSVRI